MFTIEFWHADLAAEGGGPEDDHNKIRIDFPRAQILVKITKLLILISNRQDEFYLVSFCTDGFLRRVSSFRHCCSVIHGSYMSERTNEANTDKITNYGGCDTSTAHKILVYRGEGAPSRCSCTR
jgi:hypothetical protein